MRSLKPAAGSPRAMVFGRLEEALERPATDAERALMLWLCPPAAELRRLAAARGLLATQWAGVERAPGAEVGFLTLAGDGEVAVSVDSRVHVGRSGHIELQDGLAAALAKLVAVGVRPLAQHTVIHCRPPGNDQGRRGLGAAIESLSAYARAQGVATLGAELWFDPEYGDTLLVDSVAIGWRGAAPDGDRGGRLERRPEAGDRVVAVAGQQLRRVRAEIAAAGISCAALPTSSDVPLRSVIAALGDLGLDLSPAHHDPADPASGLERARPDPARSILLVVPEDAVDRVAHVAALQGAILAVLGTVCAEPRLSVGEGPRQTVTLPAAAVREPLEIPADRDEPDDTGASRDLRLEELPEPEDYEYVLRRMLRAPNLASRRRLYERFDSWAGGRTVLHPGAAEEPAALRMPTAGRIVAVATSGNPRFTALDPYVGFCIAVCEGVRRLAACGAEPRALVGGTSFGASHDPEVCRRAQQGLAGLRDAALAFSLPCLALTTSPAGPDEHPATPPTPGLAFLGTTEQTPVTPWFKEEGDVVILLGRSREEVAGSEFAAWMHAAVEGCPPWVDFEAERALCRVLVAAARDGILRSARYVGAGGLALAVVGACCGTPEGIPSHGARISIDEGMRPDAWLFAESQARALVSVSRRHLADLRDRADGAEVPFSHLGEVSKPSGVLEFGELIGITLDEVNDIWNGAVAEQIGEG